MMLSAAGVRGRPGMVMISPQMATIKPAPADRRTSRTGTEWPLGATQVRVGAEAVLGLCHADRKMTVSGIFPLAELVADALVGQHLVSPIDTLGDGLDLLNSGISSG